MIHNRDITIARRDFLKFAGLGALGLTLPQLRFGRVLGAERSGELRV